MNYRQAKELGDTITMIEENYAQVDLSEVEFTIDEDLLEWLFDGIDWYFWLKQRVSDGGG